MSDDTFRIVVAVGVSLAAVSFLVVAIVAGVVASLAIKLKAKLDPILEKVTPLVGTVKSTADDLKPKIASISTQAVEVSKLVTTEAHRYVGVSKEVAGKATEITKLVGDEAHRYADISKDIADRARAHIAQADQAIGDAVSGVQSASGSAKRAVMRPFREIDGVFTGVATAIATLTRGRKYSVSAATQDEEMFI